MLESIKKTLRVSHYSIDDSIKITILAALLDMSRVGIYTKDIDILDSDTYDSLELKCVEFYCKWSVDYQGKAELWLKAYENLRDAMALCGEYNGGDANE